VGFVDRHDGIVLGYHVGSFVVALFGLSARATLRLGFLSRYGVKPYFEAKGQLLAAVSKTQEIGNGFDDPGADCFAAPLRPVRLRAHLDIGLRSQTIPLENRA